MADEYSGKLYEFTNWFNDKNERLGDIKIIQIGETCVDKGACIEEHIQTCCEITLIISGTGTVTADNNEDRCKAGDIQIVSKDVRHCLTADDDSRLRYIHFAFEFAGNSMKTLFEFYEDCHSLMLHDDGSVRSVLNILVDEYAGNDEYSETMKNSLVHTVLILVWRIAHERERIYPEFIGEKHVGNTVYRIIKYIDRNIDKKLTVSGIAESFSYGKEYISRLFKEKTGYSLKQYILILKMNYAKTLLIDGKCSLSEVAGLSGYGSVQPFCKAFKKHVRLTPSQFLEEAKE